MNPRGNEEVPNFSPARPTEPTRKVSSFVQMEWVVKRMGHCTGFSCSSCLRGAPEKLTNSLYMLVF